MSRSESVAKQTMSSVLGSPAEAALPLSNEIQLNNNNTTELSDTTVPSVRVHDARLYTELLDACDWTAVLRRERRARRKELLSIHNEEEAKLRAQRDALQRKARLDAEALRAARRKREAAAKAEREEALFARRMQRFFARHRRLMSEWAALGQSLDEHQARVREKIYELWEQDVFLPIQREINAKVEAKCAQDSRPHRLHDELRGFDETMPSGSGMNGAPAIDSLLAQTMGSTPMDDLTGNYTNNNTGYASRRGHEKASHNDELTWKEKKDILWRSFLAESNRLAKAHPRGGLSLHVVDAVEYDPVAQCEADTIYYKARPAALSSVDAQRVEAQKMEETYTRLALAYRDAERHSRTGVLSKSAPTILPSHKQHQKKKKAESNENAMYSDASAREYNNPTNMNSTMGGEEAMSAARRSGVEQGPNTTTAAAAMMAMQDSNLAADRHSPRATSNPSLSVPLPLSHRLTLLGNGAEAINNNYSGEIRQNGSHDMGRRQTALPSPAQVRLSAAGPFSQPRYSILPGHKGSTTNVVGAHNTNTTVDHIAQHASDVREMKRKWTLAMGDTRDMNDIHNAAAGATAAGTQDKMYSTRKGKAEGTKDDNSSGNERDIVCEAAKEVMPLPLNVNPAELHNPSSRLLPWLDLPNVRAVRPREDQLTVAEWDARRLQDTIYGRYVTPDGEQKPSCARRMRDGAYMIASDVVFDHFNFPRVAEEPHFGKRMF